MPPHSTFEPSVVVSFAADHADASHPVAKGPLTHLPSFAATTTATRKVSFNERVRAKKTIHITDFSEDEVQAYWYGDDEFRRIKRDVKFEASLLENECLEENDSKYCGRGLENFTTSGAKRRNANKRRGRSIVLEEQELQREEGSNDPDFIAETYSDAAADCQAVARSHAQHDRLSTIQ